MLKKQAYIKACAKWRDSDQLDPGMPDLLLYILHRYVMIQSRICDYFYKQPLDYNSIFR